jgi:hypothetical protein
VRQQAPGRESVQGDSSCRDSCAPCVAGYDVASLGRVPLEFAKAFMVNETSPLDLSSRKDSAAVADCLPGIARSVYMRTTLDTLSSEYIQLVSSFSICLFGLRWALRDQRQRCPVCLGKLTHPARVGQPSRNFLAFNGTELICVGGHGLLHVPEIPTSWFSTQRWMYLDPSWEILFPESELVSPGYF